MKIIITERKPEKRKIKTAKAGEAFRYNNSWYAYLSIEDNDIHNFGEFYDKHFITEMSLPVEDSNLYPAIHLGSQGFCYLNGELEADEWAILEAKLTPII